MRNLRRALPGPGDAHRALLLLLGCPPRPVTEIHQVERDEIEHLYQFVLRQATEEKRPDA